MSLAASWPKLVGVFGLMVVQASCMPALEAAADSSPASAPAPTPSTQADAQIRAASVAAAARDDFILQGDPEQGLALLGRAPSGTATLMLDGEVIPVADDGTFLIGFDRDADTGAHLVATLGNGRQVDRYLAVAAGKWRIENIDAPLRGGAATSDEFARRRPGELEQINAGRHANAVSDGWRQHFMWPVTGRRSGLFGSQRIYRGTPASYHSGTDIAVPTGTPFVAPADGVVVLAAATPFTLEGNLLMIDHGMGLNSVFLHCSRLDVKLGDRVVQGQVLGAVGQTGRATGPHLHWGMKWRDARIDPAKLAGPMNP